MTRLTRKSAVAGIALVGTLAVPSLFNTAAMAAHTARHSHRGLPPLGNNGQGCYVLRVQLRGDAAAIGTCLVTDAQHAQATLHSQGRVGLLDQPQSGESSRPATYVAAPCASTDLHIFENSDYGATGATICFYDTGFVNLTDFYRDPFNRWNDCATTWRANKWYGRFYSDTNGNGDNFTYHQFGSGDFGNTVVRNDRLSSLTIDGSA